MTALLIALVIVGLLITGLLSAGEAAVLRVTRASLADALADAEHSTSIKAQHRAQAARAAQKLVQDSTETASGLAILRVLATSLALGSLTILLTGWLNSLWEVLTALAGLGALTGVLLAAASPRRFGHEQPLRVILRLAQFLNAMRLLTTWAAPQSLREDLPPSEADLRELVDRVGESEVIEAEDRELISAVFELSGTLTREVMVPRTDMVVAPSTETLASVMRLYLRSGFSRVPVVGDSVDDLLGIAYLKDVARLIDAAPANGSRPVTVVTRPPVFVPESKPIDDLLREMQKKQTHIAVVIDEYGGVAGLITVEDILEELVGELHDEHDRVIEAVPELVEPGVFRVSARLPVDELGDLFDLRFDDDDVDTAGGLLAKAVGHVPLQGSAADVGGLHLEAERVEGRRKQVATILVSLATSGGAAAPDPTSAGDSIGNLDSEPDDDVDATRGKRQFTGGSEGKKVVDERSEKHADDVNANEEPDV